MGVTATMKVEAELSAGVWTDITADTKAAVGPLTIKYGIDGNGPIDLVASPGECSFALRNDAGNSGGLQGYYSPQHTNCRSGWGFGTGIRVSFTYSGGSITDKVKFRGKVTTIDPVPGQYGPQHVHVVAHDGIYDLLSADAKELAIFTDSDESTLIGEVLDAVPTAAQPVSRSLDTGVGIFPVAFWNLQGKAKALKVISDLAISELGRVFVTGAGVFRYKNRHNWGALNTSAVTIANTMQGFVAPTSVDRLINRFLVTAHPLSVSTAATDLLYDLPAGTVSIGPGETRELWCDYTDPNDRQSKIGGASVVTSLVSGTHYSGNASPDGLGTDLSSDLTVSLTAFGTTGKFSVENTGSATAWLRLYIYGKAIRDEGAITIESASAQDFGDRTMTVDLPYQDSPFVTQSVADYLQGVYSTLANQGDELEFIANENGTFMTHALNREPGDEITVSETVTGYSSAGFVIQWIELTVTPRCWVRCRWGLAPASTLSAPWQLDTGDLGTGTILGF